MFTRVIKAGVAVGVLDGLAAVLFGFARSGLFRPVRTFQGIAAGLLGPATFNGGLKTAALGVLCHFAVAFGWSAVYVFAFQRMRSLRRFVRSPAGTAMVAVVVGTVVWVMMTFVVLPLSNATPPVPFTVVWFQLLAIHWVAVGLPIAVIVR